MQKIVISVLSCLIVFLVGFEGFPILTVQGITSIVAALLAGGLVYWILSIRSKRHAQTKEEIDNVLQELEKVESVAESNRIFSLRSLSSVYELKNRTAKSFETICSLVDVKFDECRSGLDSIVCEIESQAAKLSETGLASMAKVLEALERLKAMNDSLGAGLAGISTNLEEVKALSETLPAMREQLISDIESTSSRSAEAISQVQSGLLDLDKGYHDIVDHIEQSSTRSDENSRNAMTALAEGLKSQAALLNAVGSSSTAKVLEALERLKAMDDSLGAGLAGISTNLEEVKALSEVIPGMRDRLISDISGTANKVSESRVIIDSIKQQCKDLVEQVDDLDDGVRRRIEVLQAAFEESQSELSDEIEESLKRRESQIENERELADREIQILKDIKSIMEGDVDGK